MFLNLENNKRKELEDKLKNEIKQFNDNENNPNLISCPDCDKKISINAIQCPNCGRPMIENRVIIEKKSHLLRFFNYLTVFLLFPFGAIVPILWGIGYTVYCMCANEEKYDITYYKRLRVENFVLAIVVFVLHYLFFGSMMSEMISKI